MHEKARNLQSTALTEDTSLSSWAGMEALPPVYADGQEPASTSSDCTLQELGPDPVDHYLVPRES